jgi:GDPmannose 4,6-dehydratase
MAFEEIGIKLIFEGEGIYEVGKIHSCFGEYNLEIGKIVVKVDPRYFRPTEVDLLIGNSTKAKNELGWSPKLQLKDIITEMVLYDLNIEKNTIL